MTTLAERAVPAVSWLRTYDRTWFRADVLAGLTAGGVVIPQAMAYATVAGLPVQVGLMTCIVPMVVYAAARRVAQDEPEHDVDHRRADRDRPGRGRLGGDEVARRPRPQR